MARFMSQGRRVWPYCAECGCRLNILPHALTSDKVNLVHFGLSMERDARGCICSLVPLMETVPYDKVKEFLTF